MGRGPPRPRPTTPAYGRASRTALESGVALKQIVVCRVPRRVGRGVKGGHRAQTVGTCDRLGCVQVSPAAMLPEHCVKAMGTPMGTEPAREPSRAADGAAGAGDPARVGSAEPQSASEF